MSDGKDKVLRMREEEKNTIDCWFEMVNRKGAVRKVRCVPKSVSKVLVQPTDTGIRVKLSDVDVYLYVQE